MGRTPRINKGAGRDHWSFCYSIVMAGGGVRGGQVYGSSDRSAAYPSTNPVSPADVAATIYHCLGIDPREHVTDQQGRPSSSERGSRFRACWGRRDIRQGANASEPPGLALNYILLQRVRNRYYADKKERHTRVPALVARRVSEGSSLPRLRVGLPGAFDLL